jgi:nitrogen fixation protein FixH
MKQFYTKVPVLILTLVVVLITASTAFGTATIVIENADAANTGFNDPTPATPVGGNSGITLGQQRLIAFQFAANIWGATLSSGPTITIRASWASLTCTTSSGVLGSAGNSGSIWRDFPGAIPGTWYGNALTNALTNTDKNGATAEITALFNVSIGTASCLPSRHWYYGLNTATDSGGLNLVALLLHEFSHGLGFQSYTNSSTGQQPGSDASGRFPSIYDRFLFDKTKAKTWPQLTDAERQASAINTGNLVWTGSTVTNAAPGVLAQGKDSLGRVLMYSPNPLQLGSSVSHWDTSALPNQLMEPIFNDNLSHSVSTPQDLTFSLMSDIGWTKPTISSSLTISGQACTGGLLSAQFTITNRESVPITLQQLTAGGRLNNDNTGAGGFPDFPFVTNLTLNPGASYTYTASQTLTRTGSYSFFVAYQKTDGSWVTNVPTDAGVSNTGSANVTGPCAGVANPMVSSSLVIGGQTCTGGVLTAQFTITNRGNAAITLPQLTAGGRLNNDNTGAGGFPDFPFATDITLNPGASYNYTGTQTLTRTGSYSFFVAYQKMDGSWVVSVPTDAGVSNTGTANVAGACTGVANPMISSSLIIGGQACTGGLLTAQFTITNRGNAAITLQQLTAGGRLNNDNTGAGGFPDFSFATNITLNPGASYSYAGNQTLTRTGSYSFFVAYQKTDGSWVVNVPTDAGVSNTGTANVTGPCTAAANPMISSSLVIGGQSCTGGVLTAQFTITNRGNAAITLQMLTAGGRLNNDNTGAGGFPDFSFATNVTLNPGASYSYAGTQTLTRTGNYSFFVAYQKTDGSWVVSVPTDAGLSNTGSANVTGGCTAAANPMVSASLLIGGQACTGGILTAQFTITNRGNAAITLQMLTAGGRLNNDNTGAGGFPDFSFATNVTLNPGGSYSYAGTQTLTRTGNYSFFVAYQKTDGSWVVNVPTDAGMSNTGSANVTGACAGGQLNRLDLMEFIFPRSYEVLGKDYRSVWQSP